MAISFLQNTEDTPVQAIPQDQNTLPPQDPETATQPAVEIQPVEYDFTETPALDNTNTENEHFLEEETASSTNEAREVSVKPSARPASTPQKTPPVIPQVRDEIILQIEKIMEEDLGDVFGALTPQQKQQFKIKGEETAQKIREVLRGAKLKLGKIVNLIFDWLKLLPGINRFFLEQEAKIKAEKIANLHAQKKHMS